MFIWSAAVQRHSLGLNRFFNYETKKKTANVFIFLPAEKSWIISGHNHYFQIFLVGLLSSAVE